MGRTHQSHNIPWQVLAEIYEQKPEFWRLPGGGKTGGTILRLRRDWDSDRIYKAMRHFARKLAAAVEEFAATEAQKVWNAKYAGIDGAKKIAPELYDRGPSAASTPYNEHASHVANGLLVNDNGWKSFLLLAHQGFPFHRGLSSMCWQFDYISYLQPYILLNLATAIDPAWLSKPVHNWIQDVRPDNIISRNHNTRCHEGFFCFPRRNAEMRVDVARRLSAYSCSCYMCVRSQLRCFVWNRNEYLKTGPDLEAGLSDYLSLLFRCLYRYHVLIMMHCGITRVNWELAVLSTLPCGRDIPELSDIFPLQKWGAHTKVTTSHGNSWQMSTITGGTILRLRRDWDTDRIYKTMRHFAQKLAKAVEEFAATEAQKVSNANYVGINDTIFKLCCMEMTI